MNSNIAGIIGTSTTTSLNGTNVSDVAYNVMITSGIITVGLASVLAYIMRISKNSSTKNKGQVAINGGMDDNNVSIVNDMNDDIDITSLYPGGILNVYYGTQTGTAESFARQIEREGKDQYGFMVNVIDLDDITSTIINSSNSDISSIINNKCIFLLATYGEGEPPDNAVTFIQQLQLLSNPQLDILYEKLIEKDITLLNTIQQNTTPIYNTNNTNNQLQYGVFALGNVQYDNYNAIGKYVDTMFNIVGGQRIVPLGLGNDDDDIENDFDIWKDTILWPTLTKLYIKQDDNILDKTKASIQKQNQNQNQQEQKLPDCRYSIQYHTTIIDTNGTSKMEYIHSNSTSTDIQNMMKNKDEHYIHTSSKHYFTSVDCPVSVVRELRNRKDDNSGSTVHIEIDISNTNNDINYTTADNLAVLPMNDPATVYTVAQALQLTNIETTVISLHNNNKTSSSTSTGINNNNNNNNSNNDKLHNILFPMPITIYECLLRYYDLTGLLRRSDLKLLASYAPYNSLDQKLLLRLSSKDNINEYNEKITTNFIGIVDILLLCPSIQIPLEHFLSICPLMQFRYYTISSSNLVYPKSIHITVSVTEDVRPTSTIMTTGTTKIAPVRKGLCSTYLATRKPGIDTVRIYVRSSTFRLPNDISKPILMIGPGTGIAPMRAFLQERSYQKQLVQNQNQLVQNQEQVVGKSILYFGCKLPNYDYIYENELNDYITNGVLDNIYVAFSRYDSNNKVYVQHLIQQNNTSIWDLIHNQQCSIYVCGGIKMGHDVQETILSIINTNLQIDSTTTTTAAKDYMSKLFSEHRYIQELWE